jgi:hypothetical protein
VSLLWTDSSELRPSNQYIFLNLMLSSSRFFLICSFHHNLESRVIPTYLAVLAYGTFVPLMKIGYCLILLFVKSICTNLDSLSFIHDFLVQIATLLTDDCLCLCVSKLISNYNIIDHAARLFYSLS